MKKINLILFYLAFAFTSRSYAQSFNAVSGVPVDLDAGSTNYSSCGSPGNKANIQFNVNGVGVLSPTNALSKVNLQFGASCGGNLRDVALYIKSPTGTCMRVYNGSGLGTSFSGLVNLSMRDGSCLNEPASANLSTSASSDPISSGNYGAFDANSSLDMSSVFNGENADGTWTLYAFESAVSAPCINAVSLEFGNPTIQDKSLEGDNCNSAILWQGGPICAGTSGKNSSPLMPGSLTGGTSFGTIGGGSCSWNSNNNNDVWIKFSPNVSGPTCILIAGLDFNLQSIVVTDANSDNDNDPCTYSGPFPNPAGNDPRWNLISCPTTSGIYSTTSGSQLSQQHCFTANAGQIYYLVVDGNGGAESAFYISGNLGSFTPLPIELLSFTGMIKGNSAELVWETLSEINNSFFELEKSSNGTNFVKLATISSKSINGEGVKYSFLDNNIFAPKNYYRLKQVDVDGNYSYSKLVDLSITQENTIVASVYDGELIFHNINKDRNVTITFLDIQGKVLHKQNSDQRILINHFPKSVYIVKIENGNTTKYLKILN